MIDFTAPGEPIPQGSKTAGLMNSAIGVQRAYVRDANGHALKPWRETVATIASLTRLRTREPTITGPAAVLIEFRHTKPKSAKRRWPSVKPDIDKLCRAVLDSLTTAAVIADDCRVVLLLAFQTYGEPGARIIVRAVDETEELTDVAASLVSAI